jgi:hypothetical protein
MDEIISYKMCAVKVRNAKLRNYLKTITKTMLHGIFNRSLIPGIFDRLIPGIFNHHPRERFLTVINPSNAIVLVFGEHSGISLHRNISLSLWKTRYYMKKHWYIIVKQLHFGIKLNISLKSAFFFDPLISYLLLFIFLKIMVSDWLYCESVISSNQLNS